MVRISALALALAVVASPALAHEHRRVGSLEVTVGWSEEPAFAGFKNSIQVIIERGGGPVEDASLEVDVLFGEQDAEISTGPMPLDPAFDSPGEYNAPLIPSRPGTYTFHLTGEAAGQQIDEFFTSGEETFDSPRSTAEAEFPEQDPTRGEIAERLDRLEARIGEEAAPPSDPVGDEAPDEGLDLLSIGALVLAAIALVVALGRRRSPT